MRATVVVSCALGLGLLGAFGLAQTHGNASRGRALYESRCIGCHSIDANRVGPAHRGVFGRRAGAAPDYEYSAALRDAMLLWSEENLDRWLTNPEALMPGQKMSYRVAGAEDRADLIAYLRAVSSDCGVP